MLLTAGIDEAGRGPLAGPVVAAVVLLDEHCSIVGLRDSKKLSAARREILAAEIRSSCRAWAIGLATVAEIDALNILQASLLAMRRAVETLVLVPHRVIVDGNVMPDLPAPFAGLTETLVGADDLVPAVAAASILAKVERDRIMDELHVVYPQFGFDRHRGYPTAFHRTALLEWGVTPEHRCSYGPVQKALRAAGRYSVG